MEQVQRKYNRIEQISFFLGVLILVTLIGDLTYQLATNENAPPHLLVISKYEPSMPGYTYRVEIENTGDKTAEAVNIQLSLFQNGKSAETATLELKYVPAQSKETAWVSFNNEKQTSDSLKVTSLTFVKP
ncbi:hypothetical protein ED312_10470 [Sinomicrobium pectinilyticum]|uniref:CARDB domain-containing protein n=1 Tax=Sinomicrobium pectinilyticum TaxID=1084421 RepID=A0A3N0EH72_SINP1|nr:hypothetical protein [Sinomicrobium pectinilyticum]RNL87226.1 hypothetical protein ED312_10470 [Sinomicrobium pectinilyticum]